MSSFRKWRNFKISKTLVLSFHDYNIIKKGLPSKSKVDHQGLRANFSRRLMNIYRDRERKQHASLDHSETFGRSWKSLWKLWTPLNHCVVCLGMPMFTERSLMKNIWLHEEHPRTRCVDGFFVFFCHFVHYICNFISSSKHPKINPKPCRIPVLLVADKPKSLNLTSPFWWNENRAAPGCQVVYLVLPFVLLHLQRRCLWKIFIYLFFIWEKDMFKKLYNDTARSCFL